MANINHAFQTEQLIKKQYRHTINESNAFRSYGWTEIIKVNKINDLLIEFEELRVDPDKTNDKFKEQFKR